MLQYELWASVMSSSQIEIPIQERVRFRLALGATLLILGAQWAPLHSQPTVTIVGSFQSELGCPGDWQPECDLSGLDLDWIDLVWSRTLALPAGSWQYKATLDKTWDTSYPNSNIALNLALSGSVTFYFSPQTKWIADNVNHSIATVAGSFQRTLGCPVDWDPTCLTSWLQDPDGDGRYTFSAFLPAGDYEALVALNESWNVVYGDGGVQGGGNIPFSVPPEGALMVFSWDSVTGVLRALPRIVFADSFESSTISNWSTATP